MALNWTGSEKFNPKIHMPAINEAPNDTIAKKTKRQCKVPREIYTAFSLSISTQAPDWFNTHQRTRFGVNIRTADRSARHTLMTHMTAPLRTVSPVHGQLNGQRESRQNVNRNVFPNACRFGVDKEKGISSKNLNGGGNRGSGADAAPAGTASGARGDEKLAIHYRICIVRMIFPGGIQLPL